MFWRFGGHANLSSLDQVLDKPDVTLEELLDESDLIQELKQQNSKLIEFLREDHVLQKLLRYVLAEPPAQAQDEPSASPPPAQSADEDVSTPLGVFGKVNARSRSRSVHKDAGDSDEQKTEAQRRRYAYVACEILSSEVWSITEALLADTDHLHEFWDYLRRPAPLDPLQAGYFTKINETLLDKKTEDMFAFLQTLDAVVPEMLKHVDCPMVMDLLLKMISLEKHEGGQGIVDWLQSQGLLLILLSYLSPDNPPSYQTSAGDFLKAIITISANATAQDQTVIGPNELTRQLVTKQCVDQLIGYMLTGGNPLTVGVGIIIEVIRKNNSDYDGEFQPGPEPRSSDPIYLGVLLRSFSENLGHFMNLVRSPSAKKPQLKTAFGASVQPLGFDRFKTCELMAELLHCSNMGLLNERGTDAELTARDAERQRLKSEGKLAGPSNGGADDSTIQYGSSVDSHGYHHAQAPAIDNKPPKLEIQNATDEDGFEKLVVPEAEPLPDEVTFEELMDNVQDAMPEQNLESHEAGDRSPVTLEPLNISNDNSPSAVSPGEPRRVSSLTKQIEREIGDTVRSPEDETAAATQTEQDAARNPEDRPAPLFARPSSAQIGHDPIMGSPSPAAEGDASMVDESITTLMADADADADVHQQANTPDDCLYERDLDGSPVIGDLLKMQFVEHQVVPTILDFFFSFPWNNFLHNVVYDVVQQVFNGNLDHGYNRQLARNLFTQTKCEELVSRADIVQRILDGQQASDRSQSESRMRLGYMGHLTLIAEEVCKFVDRRDPEFLGPEIIGCINSDPWIQYVVTVLADTRDRDNAVLGGVRPDAVGAHPMSNEPDASPAAMLGPVSNSGNSSALADAGLTGGPTIDELSLSDPESSGGYEDGSGLLAGLGKGDDDEVELDANGFRSGNMAIDDDEQSSDQDISSASPQSPMSPADSSKQSSTMPPPLSIPPSRARGRLAARLAAKAAAAASSAQSTASPSETVSPSTSDSPSQLIGSPPKNHSPVALRLQTDLGHGSPVSGPTSVGGSGGSIPVPGRTTPLSRSTSREGPSSPDTRAARLQKLFTSDNSSLYRASDDSVDSTDSMETGPRSSDDDDEDDSGDDGGLEDPDADGHSAFAARSQQQLDSHQAASTAALVSDQHATHDDGSEPVAPVTSDRTLVPDHARPGQGPVSTPSDLVGRGFEGAGDRSGGHSNADAAPGHQASRQGHDTRDEADQEDSSSDEGDVIEIRTRRPLSSSQDAAG